MPGQPGTNVSVRYRSEMKRFVGSACKSCGGTERYKSSHSCCACTTANATAWARAHPEESRAKTARWQARNPGAARIWTKANPEKVKAKAKRWTERHPEKTREKNVRWRENNPGKATLLTRAWQLANPDKAKALSAKRIARLRGAAIGCRKEYAAFLRWVRTEPVIPCAYCKRETSPKERHRDHYIPLARGGDDTVENLRVACASCNHRKHALMPDEFLKRIA